MARYLLFDVHGVAIRETLGVWACDIEMDANMVNVLRSGQFDVESSSLACLTPLSTADHAQCHIECHRLGRAMSNVIRTGRKAARTEAHSTCIGD